MSTEVDWVLDQLGSAVDAQPADHPLKRVDRDESEILEDDVRKRTGELQEANFVGVTLADRNTGPLGLEFDYDIETIVGVRIEGLHHSEWGHVSPNGADAVDFDDLVRDVRQALLEERQFPDAGGPDVEYHSLFVENDAPQSSDHQDYFRYDFDARFVGYETLP